MQPAQTEMSGADKVGDYALVGSPLFWDGDPLVHNQGTHLTFTPGTAWTLLSALRTPASVLCFRLLVPGAPVREREGAPRGYPVAQP